MWAGQEKGGNPEEEKKGAMRSARPPQAVGTVCEVLREREKRRVHVVVQGEPRGVEAARVASLVQRH